MPYVTTNGMYLPPFGGSGIDEWNKMYAGFQSVENRLLGGGTLEQFGAIGNGIADDTGAFQAAIASIGTGYGVIQLKNTYLVTAEITLPRNIYLVGMPGAEIKGTGVVVNVVSGLNPWYQKHLIQGITFNGVGIEYGRSNATDNGAGSQVLDCMFVNVTDKAIKYTYNSWNILIDRCLFYNNGSAVYVDLVYGTPTSGSNMRILNSAITHGQHGLYVNNDNEGGFHFQISNCDFEFLDYGIKTVNIVRSVGAVIALEDCHFELNNIAHIDNDGAFINIIGGWYFSNPASSYVANFITTTHATPDPTGRIMISNARIAWLNKKFCKITGNSWGIYIENGTVWDPFPNQYQLCTDDSTSGPQFSGGQIYADLLNQTTNLAETFTYDRLFPNDTAPRQYEIDFFIDGTPNDIAPPVLQFDSLNKDRISFTLTNKETGIGKATITLTKDAFKVEVMWNGTIDGLKFCSQTVANTQDLATNGFMDFIILQLGTTGTATMVNYSCMYR